MKGKAIFNAVKKVGSKHGSTILAVVAGIGVIATAILAAKEREEADERIQVAKEDKAMAEAEERGDLNPDFDHVKLTVWETIKAAAPAYKGAIFVGVLTIGAIVGSQMLSLRQIGDIAAAYNVSQVVNERYEKYTDKYSSKVKEVLGEEKEAEIRKAAKEEVVVEQCAAMSPYEMAQRAIHTGKGTQLFYEPWSDRYFYSSKESIREAVNTLNFRACGGFGMVTLNEFYDEINLPHTNAGDKLMWEIDDNASKLEVQFSGSFTLTDDGYSYVIMDFDTEPSGKRRR